MKAIAVTPSVPGIQTVEREEPQLTAEDEVKLRVLRVGICGTDREEVTGGRADPPAQAKELVIGHEMIGQVVEIGKNVSRVRRGDFAVFTVRRGCSRCTPCLMNRPDMCRTGDFTERGIWKQDGFQATYVVDKEQYIVHVPDELQAVGVLTEPLSVSEKAIDEALQIQASRLPDFQSTPYWLYGKRCLVAGIGPIGLLAAMMLKLRGAEVYGMDIVDETSTRPQWLRAIGGAYIDSRKTPETDLLKTIGEVDLILEATGVASVEFNLLDILGINGVYVLTGIPGAGKPFQVQGDVMLRKFVLQNHAMAGSVNAARDHYQMAVSDLHAGVGRWGDHIAKLITHRFPATDAAAAFEQHGAEVIKTVIEWSEPSGSDKPSDSH